MVTITIWMKRPEVDEALFPNKDKKTSWVPKLPKSKSAKPKKKK